jgi:antitoxin component YwqK of YwqJK toxin-antitoxin module
VKTWITVLCAVALLAGCTGKKDAGVDTPDVVDAPKVVVETPKPVVDSDQLRFQGDLWYFKEKPFTGVAVRKHENGKKESEITYKDGKKDGLWTSWHENGQKRREATYKDGNLVSATVWKQKGDKCPDTNLVDGNGITCYYHDNGQKRSEHTYKDGKEHGLGTAWYENGQKSAEYTFKDGEMDGLRTSWHENGQKYSESIWRDGKLISAKSWDEDGTPQ